MSSNRWTKNGNKCQSQETRLHVTFCCGTAKCFPTLSRCAASSRRHLGFVLGLIRPATLPSAAHDWWQMEHDGAHKPRSLACRRARSAPSLLRAGAAAAYVSRLSALLFFAAARAVAAARIPLASQCGQGRWRCAVSDLSLKTQPPSRCGLSSEPWTRTIARCSAELLAQ